MAHVDYSKLRNILKLALLLKGLKGRKGKVLLGEVEFVELLGIVELVELLKVVEFVEFVELFKSVVFESAV